MFLSRQTPRSFHARQKQTMALRGAEGDHRAKRGSSRSRGRAALVETWFLKFSRGCFGGDARGAEKGAKPHNRPRLAARRAGGPNKIEEKAFVPAGQHKPIAKTKALSPPAARRAGGPNKIGEKAFVPAGQHKPISKAKPHNRPRLTSCRPPLRGDTARLHAAVLGRPPRIRRRPSHAYFFRVAL